jgi:predicted ATPase
MNDPRGSLWRKWDLHVHSPESYHQQFHTDLSTYVQSLRTKAIEHDIEVAVITDYFSVEGYRTLVDEYCEEKYPNPSLALVSGKKLFLIPGIELRLSVFGHDKDAINLHLIFDPEILPQNIRSSCIEKLSIKYQDKTLNCKEDDLVKIGYSVEHDGRYDENLDVEHMGRNERVGAVKKALSIVTLDVDDLDTGLQRLQRGLVGTGLRRSCLKFITYKGHGSLSGFKWYDENFDIGRAGNMKAVLLNYVDGCFSNDPRDRKFLLGQDERTPEQEFLNRFKTLKPCVWGSDAHTLEALFHPSNGNTDDYTWIKSDPTFEGLRQILFEPDSRVYIGVMPDKLTSVEDNKELYIDKFRISSLADESEWFDQVPELPLNSALVSIIGNKGAGKSALADAIALSGNCESDTYSFLTVDKFLALEQRKKYSCEISFLDGFSSKRNISDAEYDPTIPSKVVYLSQSFVKDLCESTDVAKLQSEINRVLYSLIPVEERQGIEGLDQLIQERLQPFDEEIRELREKIADKNKEIVKHEEYARPEFRERKFGLLQEKKRELNNLKASFERINKVEKPKKEENQSIILEVNGLREKLARIKSRAGEIQNSLNTKSLEVKEVEGLISRLRLFEKGAKDFVQSTTESAILRKFKITLDQLFTVKIDLEPLNKIVEQITAEVEKLRGDKGSLDKNSGDITKRIKEKENILGLKEKEYQDYQSSRIKWERRQQDIIGDKNATNTIKNLEGWIDFVDSKLNEKLATLRSERLSIAKAIVNSLDERKRILEKLFSFGKQEAVRIATKANIDPSELIQFKTNLRFISEFEIAFLEMISQNKRGTFFGKEAGLKELRKIKNSIDLIDPSSLVQFPEQIQEALTFDLTKPDNQPTELSIEEQLTEGHSKAELYDYLYGFTYIETAVEIEHKGRRLQNLSPGERGTVLLIFYLLIDRDRRPLIIDQPEENLDNETVFNVLVPLIKRAKKERQIIIVTLNPNLAVVCDSEQIIRAAMQKDAGNLIQYETGSIEHSRIRSDVINILEGTDKAFMNRQDKYRLSVRN